MIPLTSTGESNPPPPSPLVTAEAQPQLYTAPYLSPLNYN